LTTEDIDRVILVGGSTRLPLVQTMVAEHLGQLPIEGVQPDLCVALGAAVQAGVLSGEAIDGDFSRCLPSFPGYGHGRGQAVRFYARFL
jgi:molecular chaperone DnaK